MTVSELIDFLKTQPQDISVIYRCYSEYSILDKDDLYIEKACKPRPDGWVQNARPDMESEDYLRFPGN